MAVGAEEYALSSLSAGSLERASLSAESDVEALTRGIDVVKLQGSNEPLVAATLAPATGLSNKNRLRIAAALGDPLRAAFPTAVIATTLEDELGFAVPRTNHSHR